VRYSVSKENYIKAIYHLQQTGAKVSTNALAQALQTKPASVTDMLQKLRDQDLLEYVKYQGVNLSARGQQVALQIVRKHRLWECFLVQKLGLGWEEVHEIAEELEHISNEKLIDRLDHFLGKPQIDPHGDPIPNKQGILPAREQVALDQVISGRKLLVCGIGDQSPAFLEQLAAYGINLGSHIVVLHRFSFDQSLQIKVGRKAPCSVSQHVSKNLFVTYAD
jgi:DtxR family transcriptional regulator, Mn-dependent transcriptional regulator